MTILLPAIPPMRDVERLREAAREIASSTRSPQDALILPEIAKTLWRQLCVAHRMLKQE